LREEVCILAHCCLSPTRRNSVLEEMRVRRRQSSRKRSIEEVMLYMHAGHSGSV